MSQISDYLVDVVTGGVGKNGSTVAVSSNEGFNFKLFVIVDFIKFFYHSVYFLGYVCFITSDTVADDDNTILHDIQ